MRLREKNLTNPSQCQLPTGYNFNKGLNSGETRSFNGYRIISRIIDNFFSVIEAFPSKPFFSIKNEQIHIKLFYYRPKGRFNNNIINNLGDLLTFLLGRRVKLQFVILHYPYLDCDILAKYLRVNTKQHSFRKIVFQLLKKRPLIKYPQLALKYKLPTRIVGIKLEISGRLETERSKPRQTVSTAQLGSINSNNKTLFIDSGSYTNKNAKGAFTVKVWTRERVSPCFSLKVIK